MECKYKISLFKNCYSCGRTKKVYKCKKINIIIGNFTCKFCKYYEKKSKGAGKNDNIQSFS